MGKASAQYRTFRMSSDRCPADQFDEGGSVSSQSKPDGNNETDTQLIVYIRTKILKKLRQIKAIYKVNRQLEALVSQQQAEVRDLWDLVQALNTKLHGLEATFSFLNGEERVELIHDDDNSQDITDVQPLPELLDLKKGPDVHAPYSTILICDQGVPPEIQATLLVDRLNTMDNMEKEAEQWRDSLKKQNKELEVCFGQLQSTQTDLHNKIRVLETTLGDVTNGTQSRLTNALDDIPVESISEVRAIQPKESSDRNNFQLLPWEDKTKTRDANAFELLQPWIDEAQEPPQKLPPVSVVVTSSDSFTDDETLSPTTSPVPKREQYKFQLPYTQFALPSFW